MVIVANGTEGGGRGVGSPGPDSDLHHMRLLAGLAPQDLGEVARFLNIRHYRPGGFIFDVGERADKIYFLDRGIVKVTIVSPDGRERILDVIDAGDTFGESFLSEERGRTSAAQSLTATVVRTMPAAAFISLMQTLPKLCVAFVRRLSDLQRRALLRLDAQMQADRGVRLLAVLVDLAERCGRRVGEGYLLPVELTQGELGRMVGLNRSSVSVLLNRKRRAGIVGGRGGTIVINPTLAREELRKAGLLFS